MRSSLLIKIIIIVIFLGLMFLATTVPVNAAPTLYSGPCLDLPNAENDYFIDSLHIHFFVRITIAKDGGMYIRGTKVSDDAGLEKLLPIIETEMECIKSKTHKILLLIDRETKFGRVQELLRVLQKEGYQVAFVTNRCASLCDFFGDKEYAPGGKFYKK